MAHNMKLKVGDTNGFIPGSKDATADGATPPPFRISDDTCSFHVLKCYKMTMLGTRNLSNGETFELLDSRVGKGRRALHALQNVFMHNCVPISDKIRKCLRAYCAYVKVRIQSVGVCLCT